MVLVKKYIWRPSLLAPLLVLLSLAVAYAQEAEIILKSPDGSRTPSRPAVTFPHEEHMDQLDCLQCRFYGSASVEISGDYLF